MTLTGITIDELFHQFSLTPFNIDILHYLLQIDFNMNTVNTDGHNLLMLHLIHADEPNPDIITGLLEVDVDIHYKNPKDNNRTAIEYAALNTCSLDVFKVLFKYGGVTIDQNTSPNTRGIDTIVYLYKKGCQLKEINIDMTVVRYLQSQMQEDNFDFE